MLRGEDLKIGTAFVLSAARWYGPCVSRSQSPHAKCCVQTCQPPTGTVGVPHPHLSLFVPGSVLLQIPLDIACGRGVKNCPLELEGFHTPSSNGCQD